MIVVALQNPLEGAFTVCWMPCFGLYNRKLACCGSLVTITHDAPQDHCLVLTGRCQSGSGMTPLNLPNFVSVSFENVGCGSGELMTRAIVIMIQ
jgi:hypothetical protein